MEFSETLLFVLFQQKNENKKKTKRGKQEESESGSESDSDDESESESCSESEDGDDECPKCGKLRRGGSEGDDALKCNIVTTNPQAGKQGHCKAEGCQSCITEGFFFVCQGCDRVSCSHCEEMKPCRLCEETVSMCKDCFCKCVSCEIDMCEECIVRVYDDNGNVNILCQPCAAQQGNE